MKVHFLRVLSLCLGLALGINAYGANYVLEPVHTQILFFCDHLGFSKSQGEFLKFNGHFWFDPENPSTAKAEVIIDAASIDMDHSKWNDHMRNSDFLDVEKYPTIEFKSVRVEAQSNKQALVHGELTMLGQTHPVILKVSHNKSGVHPFSGNYIAGFSASTIIKRSQYGMTYGLPALGDEIEIRLEIEGERVDE